MNNLQIGNGFKKGIAFVLVFINTFVGSRVLGMNNNAKADCDKVEFKTATQVREEFEEAYRMVVRNEFSHALTNQEFTNVYMALNSYIRESSSNARVKRMNGEMVTVDDFYDFSKDSNDAIDKRVIRQMIEKLVDLYNIADESVFTDIDGFIESFKEYMKYIEDQKFVVTNGGRWLIKNAGYAMGKERLTLNIEERLKDPTFRAFWFLIYDEEIYNETNRFVLRKDGKEILNNSECDHVVKALADLYEEISNRIRTANRDNPGLLQEECDNEETKGMAIIDEKDNRILVIGTGNKELVLGRRVA